MQVKLIDPSVWPFAEGKPVTLVRVLNTSPEYALIRCETRQLLVDKSAIRRVTQTATPHSAPLRWGAIVTLKDGRKVICTHPEIGMNGIWRGIPFGYRSPNEIHYEEIASIHHNAELSTA